MGISRRAYAAHRKERGLPGGVESAVRKAISTGRISTLPDGTIDPVKADAEWLRTTDPNLQRSAASHEQAVQTRNGPDSEERKEVPQAAMDSLRSVPEEAAAELGGGGITLAKARIADMALRVQRGQLALKRERGEVVDIRQAELLAFDVMRRVRDALVQMPARRAAIMAAELEADAHLVEQLLDGMVRETLEIVSGIKIDLRPA